MTISLATQFANIAVGLVANSTTPPPKKLPAAASVTPQDHPPPPTALVDDHHLTRPTLHNRSTPVSVTAIWDEYHGLNAYKDQPIAGGFKVIEENFGTKWRRGNPSYQKAFSRFQQIVAC